MDIDRRVSNASRRGDGLAPVPSWLSGCYASIPATGKRQFNLVSESQEIALGRRSPTPPSSQQYGLYDGRRARRLRRRARRSAGRGLRASVSCPGPFASSTIRIVNAFALPGGFIYVTRGILAHSDPRLRAGRRARPRDRARHRAPRSEPDEPGAILAQAGLGVAAAVDLTRGSAARLDAMSLSRVWAALSQVRPRRRASGRRARRALRGARAGYDPRDLAEVFDTLERVSEAAARRSVLPGWLSTHPSPENRARSSSTSELAR